MNKFKNIVDLLLALTWVVLTLAGIDNVVAKAACIFIQSYAVGVVLAHSMNSLIKD